MRAALDTKTIASLMIGGGGAFCFDIFRRGFDMASQRIMQLQLAQFEMHFNDLSA